VSNFGRKSVWMAQKKISKALLEISTVEDIITNHKSNNHFRRTMLQLSSHDCVFQKNIAKATLLL
jgi:hypothetical protein